MPPKRAAKETQAETQAVVKRFRQAIDDVADEYVCPITAELPVDPVTAEDGRFYERHAIEYWLKDHDTSPLTGQPLAHKELTANLVLRGMIREWRGPAAP